MMQLNRLQTAHPGRIKRYAMDSTGRYRKNVLLPQRLHLYAKGSIPHRKPKSQKWRSGQKPHWCCPIFLDSPCYKWNPINKGVSRMVIRGLVCNAKPRIPTRRINKVARYCQAIPSSQKKWRWECYFSGRNLYSGGLSTMGLRYSRLSSPRILRRCIVSLHHRLAQQAPPATSSQNGWKSALETTAIIEDYWSGQQEIVVWSDVIAFLSTGKRDNRNIV